LSEFGHLQSGFSHVPGGALYNNRSIFSYHIYCADTNRQGEPSDEFLCELMEDWWFDIFVNDYKRIGGGGFLTEWGNMPNGPIDIETINFMTSQTDRLLQSWTWWQFKSFNDITTTGQGTSESFYDEKGNLQLEKVKALSRSYAYAIAGIPTKMSFDPSTKLFQLSYIVNINATDSTEIYVNSNWHYPKGVTVSIKPDAQAAWKWLRSNRIQITHGPQIKDRQMLSVTIEPVP